MFQLLPWTFAVDTVHFWVHYGLVCLGFLLGVITILVQLAKPAPYGKFDQGNNESWGFTINQRLGHILSDATPGVLLFLLVFFLYGTERQYTNYVFLGLWQAHYIHRGIIHPLVMRYSKAQVPLGITLGGLIPNCIFSFLCADWISSARYPDKYYYDPRFIIGLLLFVSGYVTNKWADIKLRSLRKQKGTDGEGSNGYYIPSGGLFELVACPNYFGELVEWLGWAVGTWSLSGLAWMLFGCATFIPRAAHTRKWYGEQFMEYPRARKALIPFVY
ncbi:SRD5A1 [Branchiostoma lanceolatum]|uniref:SRD5A1 protein n=1 Tax=Branchiostoma lanceolatum TaxID=7740 RepID=A0A8J9ZIH8_BRALA|nr:SRD5A1 [Branchiostoma lanceolatum]